MIKLHKGIFAASVSVCFLLGFNSASYAEDSLKALAQSDLPERSFILDSEYDIYTVTENTGSVNTGIFYVLGTASADDQIKSTIDADDHSLFIINKNTTLNIKDIEIKNAHSNANGSVIKNTNSNSIINIENTTFKNNSVENGNTVEGGVISNYANIQKIEGSFSENNIKASTRWAMGAAIYNSGTIDIINADFNDNYAYSNASSSGYASGGAIYNKYGVIGSITGNFTENYSLSDKFYATAGAIRNEGGTIENINANFTGNYVTSENQYACGGAILNNNGTISNIVGNFIENYAYSGNSYGQGGAIYTYGNKITENIKGDFIGNYTDSPKGNSTGGAISANSEIKNIIGNFIGNYTKNEVANKTSAGGAIYGSSTKINLIQGNFDNNYSESLNGPAVGGAMYLTGIEVETISGNFNNNYTKSIGGRARGAAIYTTGTTKIKDITGDFIRNHTTTENGDSTGGAIANFGESIKEIKGDFVQNSVSSSNNKSIGGAIYNKTEISKLSGSFEGNYAETSTGLAQGGAIYNKGTINIVADDSDITFKDNYTLNTSTNTKEYNDIHNEGTVSLNAASGKKIELNGSVTDAETPTGTLNIGGIDSESNSYDGDVYLNSNVAQNEINLKSGTLHLGKEADFVNNNTTLSLNNGNLDLINNSIRTYNIGTLNLNGTINLMADVDLKNKIMDKFNPNSVVVSEGGRLNVSNLNLISDAIDDVTVVNFAENDDLMKSVYYTGDKTIKGLAPIYKYDVNYDNSTGDFTFSRSISNGYESLNPSIDVLPVAVQSGGLITQLSTFQKAFYTVDSYMSMNLKQREAYKMQNRYAMVNDGAYTINPTLSRYKENEVWINPYTTFEKIPLKNGPKVSNISYGTLIGTDSALVSLKHGFDAIYGGYISYNGSHQNYDGISIYQNGGSIGLTGSLFKGNFFTSLVLNAGALRGSANTYYGDEDFTMFMTGVASKTGYNFEFMNGKLIVQPSYIMSYSYVDTFDYTNSAGVKIKSKPLHAIQMEPGVKIIGNLKNGWQPYAGVSMVFNALDKTRVKANDFTLPSVSVKPYVKYGVGVRRNWKERFSCFIQAFVTNGGRNGIGLQAGFTMAVGKK